MSENTVKHISAKDAHKLIEREPSTAFIDVRSDMEFLFIGHPVGAVNIPWIDEPDFVINPDFEREVRKLILGGIITSSEHDSVPVVLICRSGNRSEEAGKLLIDHGFRHVYNVEHGFEGELDDSHHRSTISGWRFDQLPWQQC
jgi:rhodanese-related sulfurtransferase